MSLKCKYFKRNYVYLCLLNKFLSEALKTLKPEIAKTTRRTHFAIYYLWSASYLLAIIIFRK